MNSHNFELIQTKKCKGPGYVHYILPAYKGVHINEILGYCKPCWIRHLVADNYHPTNPMQGIKKHYNKITAGGDLL